MSASNEQQHRPLPNLSPFSKVDLSGRSESRLSLFKKIGLSDAEARQMMAQANDLPEFESIYKQLSQGEITITRACRLLAKLYELSEVQFHEAIEIVQRRLVILGVTQDEFREILRARNDGNDLLEEFNYKPRVFRDSHPELDMSDVSEDYVIGTLAAELLFQLRDRPVDEPIGDLLNDPWLRKQWHDAPADREYLSREQAIDAIERARKVIAMWRS